MNRYIVPVLGILSVTALSLFWYLEKRDTSPATSPDPERQEACEQFLMVALFESGEAADEFMEACLRGEPVLPEELPEEPPAGQVGNTEPHIAPGCAVGGCSSQICGEAGEVENIATTCEYRAEYACYQQARCERQSTGQCGWTETAAYTQCVSEATATESDSNSTIY